MIKILTVTLLNFIITFYIRNIYVLSKQNKTTTKIKLVWEVRVRFLEVDN